MKDENPREVYGDIIDLPYHQSSARSHMSLYDRAAQFSPFAVLSGYSAMVAEEARRTDSRRESCETDSLDQRLALIAEAVEAGRPPEITVTYFAPDERKSGGSCQRCAGTVKRVDLTEQKLVFYGSNGHSDGERFGLDQVVALHGDLLDRLDDSLDTP